MRERVIRSILIGSLWFLAASAVFWVTNPTNWLSLASLAAISACGGALSTGMFGGK